MVVKEIGRGETTLEREVGVSRTKGTNWKSQKMYTV
jgi:hypothetical protein